MQSRAYMHSENRDVSGYAARPTPPSFANTYDPGTHPYLAGMYLRGTTDPDVAPGYGYGFPVLAPTQEFLMSAGMLQVLDQSQSFQLPVTFRVFLSEQGIMEAFPVSTHASTYTRGSPSTTLQNDAETYLVSPMYTFRFSHIAIAITCARLCTAQSE
ncbi:hypothetical protein BV22DRAFT_886866 [Leucogyrophana mollusca]|uniref:Uncharacterized protein n=1 Tax=Leucogyrophana mollusca TaxID=85980 RepID=A0ACB8AZM1_9AGAM|nr:hypothetical protein BV22DRAFT_886866 [Leucogyrophana mollusca]